MKTQRLCFNLQSICSFGNSLSFRCISPSVTPFVRSSLHSKSSLHSQSFTFGSFLLAVSSLIINSIQSVFTPQVHSFTQSFISKLIQSFSSLDQGLVHTTVPTFGLSLSLAQQAKLVPFARSQVTFSRFTPSLLKISKAYGKAVHMCLAHLTNTIVSGIGNQHEGDLSRKQGVVCTSKHRLYFTQLEDNPIVVS